MTIRVTLVLEFSNSAKPEHLADALIREAEDWGSSIYPRLMTDEQSGNPTPVADGNVGHYTIVHT